MTPGDLKELLDRLASALERRPAFARSSGHARVRLEAGLACDVELEARTLRADLPAAEGGSGTGLDPDQLLRASLGASLAMGCRIWGARLGVAVDAVEIELQCEGDARGALGVSPDVAVGWSQIRIDATLTSAAPDEAVRRVFETACRLSPTLATLAPAVRRVHRLTIARPESAAPVVATERPVPSEVTPWITNPDPLKQRKTP